MKKNKTSSSWLWIIIFLVVGVFMSNSRLLRSDATQTTQSVEQRVGLETTSGDELASFDVSSIKGNLEIPTTPKGMNELLICHAGYTVSYNPDTKLPNWVAWKLTPDRLAENYSRTNHFLPDPALSPEEAVTTEDYRNSGYDRGHMCPAGDNRWNAKAMKESFYMTNMCPQDHNLNRGDWKELEEACRDWANRYGEVYIVCGPILYKQKHERIGDHRVVVPEAFYKVVLSMNPPRALGFIYKNTSGNKPLQAYTNSVDQVERITGIDFFPKLPDKIEKKVEAQTDNNF